MSFNWHDYLLLAQTLFSGARGNSLEEAKLRSAISRAYYAAFCLARNHLIHKEGVIVRPSSGVHMKVIDRFKYSRDRRKRRIGTNLNRLRIDRNKSDYEDRMGNLYKKAELDLKIAEQIIATLAEL